MVNIPGKKIEKVAKPAKTERVSKLSIETGLMAPNIPTNDSQISNFIEDEVKKIDLKVEEEN